MSLINWIIKATKDKKRPKWQIGSLTVWLLSPPLFRKTSGEAVNAAYSRRLWLSPWWFWSQKCPDCIPGLFSVLGLLTKSTLPALSRSSWQRKVSRQYPQQTLFSLSKCEVGAGWLLTVPGPLLDKLGNDHADYFWTWVCNAFWQWYQCCNKCIWIGGNYLEELRNKRLSICDWCLFIELFKSDFKFKLVCEDNLDPVLLLQ